MSTQENVAIARVAGGTIAEHWGLANQWSLLQQLGVMPAPDGGQH